MKAIDLLEVLVSAYGMSSDAEVRIRWDEFGDTAGIEQALIMKNGGTVEVWLCDQAIVDER